MASDVGKSRDSRNSVSLRDKMAGDAKFRELTEKGLAELATGSYLTWEEVREFLADSEAISSDIATEPLSLEMADRPYWTPDSPGRGGELYEA